MDVTLTQQCPITGQKAKFYCRKDTGNYYINPYNGVIFLYPMPNINNMEEYANEHYQTGMYKDYLNAKELKILTANVRLKQIEKYKPGKNMLDVGCSAGFFLEAAQAHGYSTQGIEFAAAAIAQAAPSVRNNIIQGDLHKELHRWKQDVDWVSAFDIIEHMHNPVKFISEIKDILKPGGLLVMSTPDTGHFLCRLMRSGWSMLQPLQHTVLFSRQAMKDMLLSQGFTNVKIESTHKYLTFEYLTKQLMETNKFISSVMKAILAITPKAIAQRPFKINISEFIVFAQKPI
jgi:2-polyprenyl-3-methyl-5-hydroxy-6-metoxy-1,4-benzoquinol methylase